MTSRRFSARRWAIAAIALAPAMAQAQRGGRAPLEFTQQLILVSNFHVSDKPTRNDLKFGRRVGDDIRDKLSDLVNGKGAKVIGGYDTQNTLVLSSYSPDTVLTMAELHVQGQFLRSDEIVVGKATRLPGGQVKVEATLHLWRDVMLKQPIPAVTARSTEDAAKQVAAHIHASRAQLTPQRRCENALRTGRGQDALRAAQDGIQAYPRGALVRTCRMWALANTAAPVVMILEEAQHVLSIDPTASYALEAAAVALDTLRRRDEAATMWLRLAATDSNNVKLIEQVVSSLVLGGNARKAEALITRIVEQNPDHVPLLRQKWAVMTDIRKWSSAIATGERLMQLDSVAVKDSTFYLRLATAYRFNGQPFKSVETVARGVSAFPGDSKMYALYTQFIKEESDTVIGRGLGLFPGSAELAALNARDLRARGKVAESLDASKRAVELDSTLSQGRLMIAQSELELGRPDSALATMRKATAAGEDSSTIAQFALSKGNALLRTANGTKSLSDFHVAMRYLAFADSLRPTPQSKFLLGVSAVTVAQMALMEAPNVKEVAQRCTLAQLGAETLPIARLGLDGSGEVMPDVTKQYRDYLEIISPYAEKQIAAFCTPKEPGTSTRP
jgi:tetratricopeptide (TPR) repeat protein